MSSVSPFPDSDLLLRLIAGEEHALELLHQRYHTELWRFAYSILKSSDLAEDVVQDAFVSAWNKRAILDPERNIRAYLYGTGRNGALMYLRADRLQEKTEILLQGELSSRNHTPGEETELADLRHRVAHSLQQLTERQRTAITLRWLRQMPYEEVASIMGISRQAVDALLQRTYGILRDVLAPFKNGH